MSLPEAAPSRAKQLQPVLPVLILAGLAVMGACVLAGDAAVLALSRFAMDGGIVLAWAAAAAGIGGWVLRGLRLPPSHLSLRLALSLGLGWGVMSLVTLLLGLAGAVGTLPAWGLVATGCVAGAVLLRGREMAAGDGEPTAAGTQRWAILGLTPLLAMGLFLALVPAGFLWRGEPNGFDVTAYHFQLPREWYELGRIVPLKHNVFSFMPLGMEMHYLTAMGLLGGPWGGAWAGMYAGQMMHLAFFVAGSLAAYGAVRPWGRGPAVVAAIALVAAPHCLLLAPIGYNEGVQVLYGTLLLATCMAFPMTVATGAVAGLVAGFAIGGKLTAIPLWLPVPILAAFLRPTLQASDAAGEGGRPMRFLGAFALAAALAAAPWLVRTAAWSGGNPVFPLAAKQLGQAHFTDEQVARFDRAHAPREDQRALTARLRAFSQQVIGAREFGWVLLPLAVAAGAVLVRRRAGQWLLAVLGVHVLVWLLATHLQSRFFVPALPVMAMLIALAAAQVRQLTLPLGLAVWGVSLFSISVAWGGLSQLRDAQNQSILPRVLGLDGRQLYLALLPEEIRSLPLTTPLTLVGEGQAYRYVRPTGALKYTTVFDAAGADVPAAWRVAEGDALWINPSELRRYHETYGTPLPPDAWRRSEPFLLTP